MYKILLALIFVFNGIVVLAAESLNKLPQVFMTKDISSNGLMNIYKALNATPTGKVAIKISTGEPGGENFLAPNLIKELVQSVNGTIVESNTAYGGARSNTESHMKVAEDHGFTAIAAVDILDAKGSLSLPVKNGNHLTENLVGSNFPNYEYYIILSHFKGHAMGGFGGAIKNISVGIASAEGKKWIHSAGKSKTSFQAAEQNHFLESMAESASSIIEHQKGKILYINVMNKLSVDCDCDGNPDAPDMHDIGILASFDPVALDKACVDLVYAAPDGKSLIERMESRGGIHTLIHSEKIGVGSQNYQLVNID